MSRAAFKGSEALRQKVRYLSGIGIPQDDIAKIVECSPKTLRKHFRRELDRGAAEGIATVAGYLFAAAKAGNVTAQIFIMKTRAGWKERVAHEVSGPGGKPEQQPITIVISEDEANF